jgi:RNA polymerase sigma factor (sigma-70 family)
VPAFNDVQPFHVVIQAETVEAVRRAIGRLRPQYREALWLRHFQGMSMREIAERLAISPSSASERVARAETMLAQYLAGFAE